MTFDGKPMFRVIIAGSRTFCDYPTLRKHADRMLSKVSKTHEIVIVSGGARGAGWLGEQYASNRGYPVITFAADWEKYGKRAGMIRNELMAQNAEALIVFWDGESKGTKHMIDIAKKHRLKISVKLF